MGCWAIGSFGNDSAADWLADLLETSDLEMVREAIASVLAADGYVESYDATEGLAAIEVVAVALGRPTENAKAQTALLEWIVRVQPAPEPSLVADAQRAIDRILAPGSELLELWEETEDLDEWRADVTGLQRKLTDGIHGGANGP
ncbi:DUF4259 domain-containing protein [Luteimonas panaciterrae]|uniref:DUF4259 domain-containing protein n=1 Tax=Luteimonas panaciterrae TaxID=363885 RepID=UPI001CFBDFD2|nr:DUF4259 domain-containing protein [Luteimonas panaciterrae]